MPYIAIATSIKMLPHDAPLNIVWTVGLSTVGSPPSKDHHRRAIGFPNGVEEGSWKKNRSRKILRMKYPY